MDDHRRPTGYPLRVHPFRSIIGLLSWFVHLGQVEDEVPHRGQLIGTEAMAHARHPE